MRRRTTTWMWAEACQVLAQTERLRQGFFELETDSTGAGPAWQAPVDIFENGRELVVWIALPGVAPENVQVRLHGNRLSLSAFRSLRIEPPSAKIRRVEIPHGRLERHIDLPAAGYVLEARDGVHGCMRLCLRRH
jgi:HSP20 family protein